MNSRIHELRLPENPELAAQVHALLAASTEADGVDALSEQFVFGVDDARLGHEHTVAVLEDQPVAVLALSGEEAELAVHPACRRRGLATEMLNQILTSKPNLKVWAHGNLDPAQGLAKRFSAQIHRELLVMGLGERPQTSPLPADVRIVNLAEARQHWGELADEGLLKANNEAFHWHPEQGNWGVDRWERAQEASWFSPEDVLLLVSQTGVDGPEVLGFHWTKWPRPQGAGPSGGVGEVYVVGLADAVRGRKLGGPLIAAGLTHLFDLGAAQVILYVESDNEAAVSAYRRLGFDVLERHVVYGH